MTRPRMLMVSPAAPWPGTTGGLVRIAALLEHLAPHFDITFVSPRRPDQRLPDDLGVRFICPGIAASTAARRARAVVSPSRPYHVAFYTHEEVRRLIARELAPGRYDVVYGHFIYSLEYLRGTTVPVIVDQQNVDRVYWSNKAKHSAFPLAALAAWNTRKTVAYENRRLSDIWAYVSVSDEDREQTRAYAHPAVRHFWVAPNGVDTTRFVPRDPPTRTDGEVTLGYLGSMDLQMNVEAVDRFGRELLPRIRQALDGVPIRFLVIGSHPSAAVRALAAETPGMTLSGTVPDVVPWLQRLDVLVCPLRIGAGTKLKVAEAMACGIPVVGSPLALAGLAGTSGEHYVRAAADDSFVEAVCRLVRTPREREAMGRKARELAQVHLDWRGIAGRLAADITRALDGA